MRYNLNAESQDALIDALMAAGLVADTEDGPCAIPGVTLDIIGTIYKKTGETVMDGDELVEIVAPTPGWHANMIADLTSEQEDLLPLIPPPINPNRIFAGE